MNLEPTRVIKNNFLYNYKTSRSIVDPINKKIWLAVLDPLKQVWVTWSNPGIPYWQNPEYIRSVREIVDIDLIQTTLGAVLVSVTDSGEIVLLQMADLLHPVPIPSPQGTLLDTIRAVTRRGTQGDTIIVGSHPGKTSNTLYERHIAITSWPPKNLGADWDSMGDGFIGAPSVVDGTNELWVFAPGDGVLYYRRYNWAGLWGIKWFYFPVPFANSCFAGKVDMGNGDRYVAVSVSCGTNQRAWVSCFNQQDPSGGLYPCDGESEASWIASQPVSLANILVGCQNFSGQIYVYSFFVKEGSSWKQAFVTSAEFPDRPDIDLVWSPEDVDIAGGPGYLSSVSSFDSESSGTTIALIGAFGILRPPSFRDKRAWCKFTPIRWLCLLICRRIKHFFAFLK